MRNIQILFICGNDSDHCGSHFPMDFKTVPRVNDYVEVVDEHQWHYTSQGLSIVKQVNKVLWKEYKGNQIAHCYL